jgi:hypothetical protein
MGFERIRSFVEEYYYVVLTITVGIFLLGYGVFGWTLDMDFLSTYMLVVFTALLLFPIFQEMEFLGFKFKRGIRKEVEAARRLEMELRLDVPAKMMERFIEPGFIYAAGFEVESALRDMYSRKLKRSSTRPLGVVSSELVRNGLIEPRLADAAMIVHKISNSVSQGTYINERDSEIICSLARQVLARFQMSDKKK